MKIPLKKALMKKLLPKEPSVMIANLMFRLGAQSVSISGPGGTIRLKRGGQ